jgi:hypothetical protein
VAPSSWLHTRTDIQYVRTGNKMTVLNGSGVSRPFLPTILHVWGDGADAPIIIVRECFDALLTSHGSASSPRLQGNARTRRSRNE